eukprot:634802-Alexandrium_andersonii.AAC.1
MSASLVGSEMCIRDRNHVEAAEQCLVGPGAFGHCWAPSCEARNCMWTVPVSYTHLTLPTICSV